MGSTDKGREELEKNIFRVALNDYRIRVLVVVVICTLGLFGWKMYNNGYETTDNAIVQCDFIDVVSETAGIIDEIYFEDNSYVSKDERLVRLRDSHFRSQVRIAESELEVSKYQYFLMKEQRKVLEVETDGKLTMSKASLDSAHMSQQIIEHEERVLKAQLGSTKSELEYFRNDLERITRLYKKKIVSKQNYQEAKRLYDSAKSKNDVLLARLELIHTKHDLEVHKTEKTKASNDITVKTTDDAKAMALAEVNAAASKITLAEANLELAKINLRRSNIIALRDGHITNRRVSTGEYIEIGQPIASITSCSDKVWIEANFKETQIGFMEKGQEVLIYIDTYPDVVLKGVLDSISNGSGATFSVLPPENAVGNFTKVVQRFPVKINVTDDGGNELRVGMSAIVTVDIK